MWSIVNVAHTEVGALHEIIHFKNNSEYSIFSKTALNWANENQDQFMALELVKLEHEVHRDKNEGLLCLKMNLSNADLLPLIADTYNNFYGRPQYWTAFFVVFFQLGLLSYLLFFLDIYFDINLAISYKQFASESFDMNQLWMCGDIQLDSSCYERTGSDYPISQWPTGFNKTYAQTFSHEDMHHSFYLAFCITAALLIITMLYYMGYIFMDSSPKWFNKAAKIGVEWRKSVCGEGNTVLPYLQGIGWSCKMILILVGKLLWPVIHFMRRVRYEASPKRSQHLEQVANSDSIWHNIKFLEYGLESSIQLFLQLWLLQPFLPTIAAWDTVELIGRCLSGFVNFFTFELHPACYVEKVLIKIVLSVLSLSLGMSQMRRKPGQHVGSTLPMFVSIVAQTVGRMFAFKSLVLLSPSLGYHKYAIFLSTHILLVLLIKTLFEVKSLKDSIPSYQQLVDIKSMRSRSWQVMRFIISGILSTIVMIHMQADKNKKHSFLSHLLFHLLIILENLILVCLPYILDENCFPPLDCFTPNSKLFAVSCVLVAWLVGVLMHYVQYKLCHPWGAINGPQVGR
jgi:hypothetical protein